MLLPPWDGTTPSTCEVDVPNDVALVDAVFFAQGAFQDAAQPPRHRLTNALRIEIGPP